VAVIQRILVLLVASREAACALACADGNCSASNASNDEVMAMLQTMSQQENNQPSEYWLLKEELKKDRAAFSQEMKELKAEFKKELDNVTDRVVVHEHKIENNTLEITALKVEVMGDEQTMMAMEEMIQLRGA
jgi:hypothetical protein